MEIQRHRLLLHDKELVFADPILSADRWKNKIVIVFKTDFDAGFDNLYCYDENQNLIWRIQQVPKDIGGTARATYVHVCIKNGLCTAVDFAGRRFTVNMDNGKIVSKTIVK